MKITENDCPLCGGDNQCMVGTEEQSNCWCMQTKFPKGLLEAVPPESKDRYCICQKCIDTYYLKNSK